MKRGSILLLLLAAQGLSASPVWACAACFGKSDSALAYGMNAGILALLAVIGSMLALVAGFFVFIVRRGSRLEVSADDAGPTIQS